MGKGRVPPPDFGPEPKPAPGGGGRGENTLGQIFDVQPKKKYTTISVYALFFGFLGPAPFLKATLFKKMIASKYVCFLEKKCFQKKNSC